MTSPYHCKPSSWGFSGDFIVNVACFDHRGVAWNAWIAVAALGRYDYGASILPL